MKQRVKKRKQLRKKLLHKYRLVVLNEDTFEERISLKLNRLNVFVVGTLLAVFLIAGTTILIAFTPLREYIPGYSSTALKKQATTLAYEVDSLQARVQANDIYLSRIRQVLTGEIKTEQINKDSLFQSFKTDTMNSFVFPIREDSLLRQEVALEDKYNVFETASSRMGSVLFAPLTGSISGEYNPKQKHFAVDVVAPQGTPVKAVSDGTVIFSEWTTETGYVIIIEHGSGLISAYKHNEALTKRQGDQVKAGEVIATVGNTGELTTGPHLHFELWSDGYPVNPLDYVDFQ